MIGEEQYKREQSVLAPFESAGLWQLNWRRIRAMILGIALALLIHLALSLSPSSNIAGGLITWHPEIAVILFCGVVFGPFVGLIVGGGSSLLEDIITYHISFWNWELGYALIGLLASLSVLVTIRRSSRIQSVLLMELVSLLAVVVGIGLASGSDMWVLGIDLRGAAGEWLFAGTSDLANGLVLLLLFLAGYYQGITVFGRRWRKKNARR